MGVAVGPVRARMVARYLRSHTGIPSIQGPVGNSATLLTPQPYRITVTAGRGVAGIARAAEGLIGDRAMWVLIAYTKDTSIEDAKVVMSVGTFTELLTAHYEHSRGAFNDAEGR